ncbi:MAG: transposase, partial [Lentisphaeraceae bacterium]|nr:transposase [Lentisphaeraceae bacterium]
MREEFKNNNWSKRYLPHYNADLKYQMITYRLADSLSQKVQKALGAPQDSAGIKLSETEKRKLTEESLDKGYGSCLLSIPELADEVVENWKYFHGTKYELIAYVVMPNHVHILIKTFPNYSLSKIVWGWKTWISKFVNEKPEYYEKFLEHYSELVEFKGFGTAPLERKVHLK